MKILKLILLVAPLLLVIGYFLIFWPNVCKKSVSDTFYLNYDYETVRKTLVRTKAKEKLIEACQGQIISEKIDNVNIRTDKILKGLKGNWRVEGSGIFRVKFHDARLGEKTLNFRQTFYITPHQMIMRVIQMEPAGELYHYEQMITLSERGSRTRVDTTTSLEIRYNAPNIQPIKDKVESDTAQALNEGVINFRQSLDYVIRQYKDQPISLSLRL